MMGGKPVLADAGLHSHYVDWKALVEEDPDVISLMPCGFDIARTAEEFYWLAGKLECNGLRAVRDNRVFLTGGGHYFSRAGPRILESLRILTEIVYPGSFTANFEGHGWKLWDTYGI